jgi:hypothetical protein
VEHEPPPPIPEGAGFSRLMMDYVERHEKSLARLTNPDDGFSPKRCNEHTEAIKGFERFQYKIAVWMAIIVVASQFIVPIILKKWFGL